MPTLCSLSPGAGAAPKQAGSETLIMLYSSCSLIYQNFPHHTNGIGTVFWNSLEYFSYLTFYPLDLNPGTQMEVHSNLKLVSGSAL